jgi:integrase
VFYDHNARSWVAVVSLGVHNGKRVRRKIRAASERAAKAELDRLQRTYRAGGFTGTLDAYLDEWLAAHRRNVRASTYVSYAGHVRMHISPLLGGIPLARLEPRDVRRLIDELERKGLSSATIVRVVTTLRIALNAAVAERAIFDNPARVRLPRVEREPVKALTEAGADAILEAVRGHWVEPITRLLLGSGMRLGEAIGLNQGDLLLEQGYVRLRVTKTRVRAVPITDDAVAALRAAIAAAPRIGPDEPVFFGVRRRDRMRGDSVTQVFPKLMEQAGLGHITPHGLRHGAATLMLTAGVPMRVISEQLGHRNPALTSRIYAHVIPEAQRAAITALERRQAR